MRKRWNGLVVAGMVFAGALAGGLSGCASDAPRTDVGEPGAYLADFDRAWELVRDTYHDTAYNGVDWDAVRDELRPRAEAARTRAATRDVIEEMVARLGESHFGIIPEGSGAADAAAPAEAGAGGEGTAGLDLRVVEGRAMVISVADAGPADRAGVRPGWIVTRVGDMDTDELIEELRESMGERAALMYAWQALRARVDGAPGTTVRLGLLDARDEPVEVEIERATAEGEVVRFGNLPPTTIRVDARWLTPEEAGDARIGLIAFNMFMIPVTPHFERAMLEFQDADGIVIDLRGNVGGVAAMCASLSRYLVAERARIGTMHMRGQSLDFNAEPVVVTTRGERLAPFAGPVAVLIDEGTASTSEFMAGGLRGLGRARTFGTRSSGMALPAAMSRLPSGDVFLHAIADYVNSDGSRLEGAGVPADEETPRRRADLLAGRDAALEAAAAWIAGHDTAE